MDKDNLPEYIKILFILNSITIIGLLALAFYVTNVNPPAVANAPAQGLAKQTPSSLENPPVGDDSGKPTTDKIADETSGGRSDATKIFPVGMTDKGFTSKGFQISSGEAITLVISNNSQKTHSLVIDELKADSGPIEPGQTKEMNLGTVPNESKNYIFYSAIGDDSKDDFGGILMVLKK